MSYIDPQSLNRYTYVLNNPLKFTDPTGNWPKFVDKAARAVKNTAKKTVQAAKKAAVQAVKNTVKYSPQYQALSLAADVLISEGTTFGIGVNLQGGAGAGGAGGFMLVLDGSGGVGITGSLGGGGYAGVGGSASVQFQKTNANSINDLKGWSSQTGGSVGPVGGEYVVGQTYQGGNVAVGIPAGSPEMHSFMEYSWLMTF